MTNDKKEETKEGETKDDKLLKHWRFTSEIVKIVDDYQAKNHLKSQEVAAAELIKLGSDHRRKDTLKPESMRTINNLYEGKRCRSCGQPIQIGETCWFGRSETGEGFIMCVECHSEANKPKLSDPTLAQHYEDVRRLQVIKAQLIKENNELADANNLMKDRQSNLPRLEEFLEKMINLEVELVKLKQETEKKIADLCTIATKFVQEKVGTATEQEWVATFPENVKKLKQKSEDIDKELSEVRKLRQDIQSEIRTGLLVQMPVKNTKSSRRIPLTVTAEPVRAGQKPPAEDPSFEGAHDPNNTARKQAGQVWCEPDTLWVFPEKCQKCKEQNPSRWNECQRKKRETESGN